MKKQAALLIAFVLAAALMSFGAERATLSGRVTDATGKPLEHATLIVYHAGVKDGYSVFCPSCYTDCGKRAITNASGAYTLNGLSPDLWFELLVLADGYAPAFVRKADPLQGPVATVALTVRAAVNDPSREVLGRVVDRYGKPVRDAVVEPQGVLVARDGTSVYGGFAGLVAVTSQNGEFEIAYSEAASRMALMIEPRALAPKFIILPTGAERRIVTVFDGPIVRGRLVEKGRPVAGAEIGLNPRDGWLGGANLSMFGSFYDEERIGTREDGTFVITNVPIPEHWNLYGKMESIASRGATDAVALATAHDGQELNLGDIEIKRGFRFQGRVALSDGKPVPKGMRMAVISARTRDSQTTELAADGSFEFVGLASGTYSLLPSVQGYELPEDKSNAEYTIDHDVKGFSLVLDPEKAASTRMQIPRSSAPGNLRGATEDYPSSPR